MPDGTLSGNVYGKDGFRDGEPMTTSIVPPEGRFNDHIVTESGTVYRLGVHAHVIRAHEWHPLIAEAPNKLRLVCSCIAACIPAATEQVPHAT